MKNIKNVKYLDKLKNLGYALDNILIVGSGTMSLFGLKENTDLDLWVTKRVYDKMLKDKRFHNNGKMLELDDKTIEADHRFICVKQPVEYYLKNAIVVNGFHFMSLENVLEWKKCMGRPKDKEHIKMIEKYMKTNVVESYLVEIQVPSILYHASTQQGLKYLDPRKTQSTHLKYLKEYVYATDDKSYAAGFCFQWNSKDGFKFGSESESGGEWELKVPRLFIGKLTYPCSLYHVSGEGFRKVYGVATPEFESKSEVRILKEERYKSARECLEQNNVRVIIV